MNTKQQLHRSLNVFPLILLFCISHVLHTQTVLEKKISISLHAPVYKALNIIGDSIGHYFSYNSKIIDGERNVRLEFKNREVGQILDSLFLGERYSYKVIGNQIVIGYAMPETFKPLQIDSSKSISLIGKVTDKSTGTGVPFATVGVPNHKKWTVCNFNGDFVLKVEQPDLDDTIKISCLGYRGLALPLIDCIGPEGASIALEMDYVSIQEVIIRRVDPVSLIRRVIGAVHLNYFNKPYMFDGFYRETILKNNNYVAVTEAVVEGYKSSYVNQNATDQLKIVKGRKIVDKQRHDTLVVKLQAGMYTSLMLDVVKNPANFIDPEYFEDYKYKIGDIILSDNKYIYVVEFDGDENSPYAFYKGKIYIDFASAAIVNVEFSLNSYGKKHAADFYILKKPLGMKISAEGAVYTVNYSLHGDGKYHLNYIRSDNVYKIRESKKFFATRYAIATEIAITSTDQQQVKRLRFSETEGKRDVFTENVDAYDLEFWKNYSYIPPEKPLLEALKDFNE
jgi:hypothetical protein